MTLSLCLREDLLGGVRAAAELSAAFVPEGSLEFALPGVQGEDPPALGDAVWTARLLGALAQAVGRHLDRDGWCVGSGSSPDQLPGRALFRSGAARLLPLVARMSPEEAGALLAWLADPRLSRPLQSGSGGRASLPSSLYAKLEREIRPCQPGIFFPTPLVARGILGLCQGGGRETTFWMTESSCALFCAVEQRRLRIKAHHALVQEEVRAWCLRRGLQEW